MAITSRAYGRESLSLTALGIGTYFDYTRSGFTTVTQSLNIASSGARTTIGTSTLTAVTNSVATGKKLGKGTSSPTVVQTSILTGWKSVGGASNSSYPGYTSTTSGKKAGTGWTIFEATYSSLSSNTKWTSGATALHGTWLSTPSGLLSYDGDTTFSAVVHDLASGSKRGRGSTSSASALQHITLGATRHRGPAYGSLVLSDSANGRKNSQSTITLSAKIATSVTGRKRSWGTAADHGYVDHITAGTKSALRGTSAAIIFHNIPHYLTSRRGPTEILLGSVHQISWRKRSKGSSSLATGQVNEPSSQGRKNGLAPRRVLSLLCSSTAFGQVSRAGRTRLAGTDAGAALGRKWSLGGTARDLGIGTLLDGRKHAFGGTQLQASHSSLAWPKTGRRGAAGATTAQIHNVLATCKNLAGNSTTNMATSAIASGRKQGLARPKIMTLVSRVANGTKRAQGSTSVSLGSLSFVAKHSSTKFGTSQLPMLASSVLRSGKNMAGNTVVPPLTIHDVAVGMDLTPYATSLHLSLTPFEPSLELKASEPSYTFEVTAA